MSFYHQKLFSKHILGCVHVWCSLHGIKLIFRETLLFCDEDSLHFCVKMLSFCFWLLYWATTSTTFSWEIIRGWETALPPKTDHRQYSLTYLVNFYYLLLFLPSSFRKQNNRLETSTHLPALHELIIVSQEVKSNVDHERKEQGKGGREKERWP